eukprot:NODE_203_length_12996_cov_1.033961.p7 type:complete len:240 gc:universal NODE_203_length_12996_cov_1.033961:70-789(+)
MSVFYKFTSAKSYNKIACDGLSIDIITLKQEIASKLHLKGYSTDFDLLVSNEEDEPYSELDKVPRNAKILLKRVPITNKQKVHAQPAQPVQSTSGYIPGTNVTTNQLESLLSTIPGLNQNNEKSEEMTEDQKLAEMFKEADEANKRAGPQQSQAKRMKGELPPPNYVCYKCGLRNHWIYDCPNAVDDGSTPKRIQRATGIPKSMLNVIDKVPVNGIQNLQQSSATGELMVTGDGNCLLI